MALTPAETERYRRHLSLPDFGEAAQEKLKRGSVLVAGAGGLGSPVLLYLAAAGVGTIGVADFDLVEITNLQRQIVHGTSSLGRSKLDSAAERLRDLNPLVEIRLHEEMLTSANALEVLGPYDVIVDGTDNFPTRYLLNDAAVILGKPYVYGSIFRFEGQASVFSVPGAPCYRCLYPEPPPPGLVPSCEEGGVLGVLPGVIGSIQATEAIKLLAGIGKTLAGRLLLFDALSMEFRQLRLRKDPQCAVCGPDPAVRELIDYDRFCGVKMNEQQEIDPVQLKKRLEENDVRLIDVRERHEWQRGHIEGAELMPLSTLASAIGQLPHDKEIVVYCQMGGRSARAADLLRGAGFTKVLNLAGGYGRWLREV